MRVIIQRVSQASVKVDERLVSEIKNGLLILLGISDDDSIDDLNWIALKIVNLRIFDGGNGKMDASVMQIGGDILLISQFTLMASTKKGNRPSFTKAAHPEKANKLYEQLIDKINEIMNKEIKKGIFGANMKVHLINDGPVTITLDSKRRE